MNMAGHPRWVSSLISSAGSGEPEDLMRLSCRLALASMEHGGGPFGALIADGSGQIVAAGWNTVISDSDSTAHAEANCIRQALKALAVTNLKEADCAPYSLFSSAAPCIQCFGMIYWSGLSRVYAAARKEDVEAIGFDEGPISEILWKEAQRKKGIVFIPDFCRDSEALLPLQAYHKQGGRIY